MYLIQVKMNLDFKYKEGTNPTQLQGAANENILSSHLFMNLLKIPHLWIGRQQPDQPWGPGFQWWNPHLPSFMTTRSPVEHQTISTGRKSNLSSPNPFFQINPKFVPKSSGVCKGREHVSLSSLFPIFLKNRPWATWTCWGWHNLPSTLSWM